MRVNEIRDRIVELSNQGGGADSDLNQRAMGWLNSAYHELMDELLPFAPVALQRREEVESDGVGQATLSLPVHRLLRVADKRAARMLEVSNPLAMLDADPAGTLSGDPRRVYASDTLLVVQPVGAIPLTVLYVPAPVDLQEGGAEASILLPRTQHSGLVWGGLVWSALFERSFVSQSELAMYQRQWQAAKEAIRLALLGSQGGTLRVQPFDYV